MRFSPLSRWLACMGAALLCWCGMAAAVRPEPEAPPPLLLTNLSRLAAAPFTNLPARLLLPVRLEGTVQVGGAAGSIIAFDGSPTLQVVSGLAQVPPLERGQRVVVEGTCLLIGTQLVLEPRPLVDNDGLHSMGAQSAGVYLRAGRHPIRVRYFNKDGQRGLAISLQGPDLPTQALAGAWLSHAETEPGSGAAVWRPGLTFQCYEGSWDMVPDFDALPCVKSGVVSGFDINVAGKEVSYGIQFEGAFTVPREGLYVLSSSSDDGSQVYVQEPHATVWVVGQEKLPALRRLAAGQLLGEEQGEFCAELEGRVTFVSCDSTGLNLELAGTRGQVVVRVPSRPGAEPQWLVGARVRAAGICQNVFTAEGYQVAGRLLVPAAEEVQLLEVPQRFWKSQAVETLGQVAAALSSNAPPALVHVRGTGSGGVSGLWRLEDGTGALWLAGAQAAALQPGVSVEVLGQPSRVGTNAAILGGLWRSQTLQGGVGRSVPERRAGAGGTNAETLPTSDGGPGRTALPDTSVETNAAAGLPLLTTVEAVKQMSREEAKRGYPVRVRGVVTFVWPDAGFFLQDATSSIDVRLRPAAASTSPHIGEYWEVTGETFAEFAPNINARQARRLGPGALPEALHPNWGQLLDGSLDTRYVEVQGVVSTVQGDTLWLLTRDGRLKVELPEMAEARLQLCEGALVRVRGCLIPGRNVNTQQVRLGEFALRNASLAVDEPAPPEPFALPLKRVADLLLFDAHASPIQRTRLEGVLLQQRDGICFVMDGTNGVRVLPKLPIQLVAGERVEMVGFPDLSGPAPVLRDALVRCVGVGTLPAATKVAAAELLDGRRDSTLVELEATLVSRRRSEADQVLELHSGPRLWMARLANTAGPLPTLALGSELRLTGVYRGQGGDRGSGREIDAFELLLNSPADVVVVHRPSWWTARRGLEVAGALLAVLLLAFGWIGALRRQVEERTVELKNEIEEHKHTELKLEEKTRMLRREIDERLRVQAEVERGHKQLLLTSRLAGMAEVATSVLHNVGNVMTVVNVLSASLVEQVRHSKLASVARLGELLGSHKQELSRFVTEDERGRKMPDYVERLGAHLLEEQARLLEKVKVLNDNVQHINEIVAMQQEYAKVSGVLEHLPPEEVVEDALRMQGESLKRHGIQLVRAFAPLPPMTLDRHKVLQILFNLLENAKYACLQGGPPDKQVTVRLEAAEPGRMHIVVVDNGMGIAPENLTRIFGQGFSTRKDGHGFGLHSSVLAAQDMGGKLTAYSQGVGRGATFILELPLTPPPKPEARPGQPLQSST